MHTFQQHRKNYIHISRIVHQSSQLLPHLSSPEPSHMWWCYVKNEVVLLLGDRMSIVSITPNFSVFAVRGLLDSTAFNLFCFSCVIQFISLYNVFVFQVITYFLSTLIPTKNPNKIKQRDTLGRDRFTLSTIINYT